MKTYLEKAKDKEILKNILLYIVSDSDSAKENELAEWVENATDGQITKNEFHDWIASFDINSIEFI
jgi:hypothetical protein